MEPVTSLSRKNWNTTASRRAQAFVEGLDAYPNGENPYILKTYMHKEFNSGFFYSKGYDEASRLHVPSVPEKSPYHGSYMMGWDKRKLESGN
jgi:hypothetical protein